jgi:hypothetical protein
MRDCAKVLIPDFPADQDEQDILLYQGVQLVNVLGLLSEEQWQALEQKGEKDGATSERGKWSHHAFVCSVQGSRFLHLFFGCVAGAGVMRTGQLTHSKYITEEEVKNPGEYPDSFLRTDEGILGTKHYRYKVGQPTDDDPCVALWQREGSEEILVIPYRIIETGDNQWKANVLNAIEMVCVCVSDGCW